MIYTRSPDVAFDEFNLYTFCTSTHAPFSPSSNSCEHVCFFSLCPTCRFLLFKSFNVIGFCWVVCPFHPPGYRLTELVPARIYNSLSRSVFALTVSPIVHLHVLRNHNMGDLRVPLRFFVRFSFGVLSPGKCVHLVQLFLYTTVLSTCVASCIGPHRV